MTVLRPLYEATVEMSFEKRTTGSKIIPLTKSLLGWYAAEYRRQSNDEIGCDLCHNISRVLYERFSVVEECEELALATLCDPRFKKHGFKSAERARAAIQTVKNQVQLMQSMLERGQQDDVELASAALTAKSSLWASFDDEVFKRVEPSTSFSCITTSEITRYLSAPNCQRNGDPLEWWRLEEKNFPNLSQIAFKYLTIQATSVPSERVFSTAGNVINKKRNRLSDKHASLLILLKENL